MKLGAIPVAGLRAPLEIGRKLFVDGNLAYVGFFTGYSVIDVSDPENPELIGSPAATQLAVHDLTGNGSGLILPVTSFAGQGTLALSLYDGTDPTDVTQFLTSIDTPGDARARAAWTRTTAGTAWRPLGRTTTMMGIPIYMWPMTTAVIACTATTTAVS